MSACFPSVHAGAASIKPGSCHTARWLFERVQSEVVRVDGLKLPKPKKVSLSLSLPVPLPLSLPLPSLLSPSLAPAPSLPLPRSRSLSLSLTRTPNPNPKQVALCTFAANCSQILREACKPTRVEQGFVGNGMISAEDHSVSDLSKILYTGQAEIE